MDHAEGLVCTLESLDTAAEVEALLAALEYTYATQRLKD